MAMLISEINNFSIEGFFSNLFKSKQTKAAEILKISEDDLLKKIESSFKEYEKMLKQIFPKIDSIIKNKILKSILSEDQISNTYTQEEYLETSLKNIKSKPSSKYYPIIIYDLAQYYLTDEIGNQDIDDVDKIIDGKCKEINKEIEKIEGAIQTSINKNHFYLNAHNLNRDDVEIAVGLTINMYLSL